MKKIYIYPGWILFSSTPTHEIMSYSDTWIKTAELVFTEFKKSGQIPYVDNGFTRTTNCVCTPFCCLPCIIWSCVWRVACCPCQCCNNGISYMCSNNGCTDPTDNCVGSMYEAGNKRVTLPKFPDVNTMSTDNKKRISILFTELIDVLEAKKNCYSKYDYDFVGAMFATVPCDAILFMKATLPSLRCT